MATIPENETPAPGLRRVARPRLNGLWRHRDFMRLWTGQTISQLGSTVTREALPYAAILTLHATPAQMGLLGAAGSAPVLLIGLFAGVWVDRLRRRPIMIAADLGRALLLLSAPAAYLLGILRIEQLYLVAALAGVLSVFFDVAYTAYLPALVERGQIVEANSKLGMSAALAEIAGPSLGGALVQLLSGPIAVLLDAISYLFSAAALLRIRAIEPAPAPSAERSHIRSDLADGLRAVWSSPLLRALAGSSVVRNFFGWFFGAIYGLYALNELGMTPLALGLTVACGGVGSLLGALLVAPATRRYGVGPATLGALLLGGVAGVMTWGAGGLPGLALPLMAGAQVIGDMLRTLALINQTSIVQTITPDRILGRVNASMHVLDQGVGALGLLAGGALAGLIGLRPTIGVSVLGSFVGALWLVFSPLRRMRDMPALAEESV